MESQNHRRRAYLIQDPYNEDAIRFMDAMFKKFGLRPVCFYTDQKAKFYGERQFPILRSSMVEASYDVDLDDIESFAAQVMTRFDIVAIVPFKEDSVEVAAALLPHIGLSNWNSPETLLRFRDKDAMKKFIAETAPAIRVPVSRIVRSIDDVYSVQPPKKFVIKPNSGQGSEGLGFFSRDDSEALSQHFALYPGEVWIMEEYIDGPEYMISGLVRRDGSVQSLGIWRYFPKVLSENFVLPYAFHSQLKSTDPMFIELNQYVTELMQATGVRGVPFHIELRVDENGPAMVDISCRVTSDGGGMVMSYLHPERPDFYTVAAHDYVGPNNSAMEPIDYTFYDEGNTMWVAGVSTANGRIECLEGIAEVEALPEFIFWSVRPEIGDALEITNSLRSCPYIANFRHDGGDERSREIAKFVHESVRWNVNSGIGPRLAGAYANIIPRAVTKIRWLAHRMAAPVSIGRFNVFKQNA